MSGNMDFLEEYSGVGLESIRQRIPYVSITQDGKKTGDWRYSPDPDGGVLDNRLTFHPLFTYDVWVERSGTGKDVRTVAYHQPNSIPLVKVTQPKFSITHAETGNRIDCTVAIGMVVCGYEHNEFNGFGLYIPTVLSLTTIRQWQNALTRIKLSSGNKAPIFAHVWEFTTGDRDGKQAVVNVTDLGQVKQDCFMSVIKPMLDAKDRYQLITEQHTALLG